MSSKSYSNTFIRRANIVLCVWVFVLLAPMLLPRAPVVEKGYVLVRVCSLLSGVQYVKIPTTDADLSTTALSDLNGFESQATQHHLDKIHANCKCGLNVDHLLVVPNDVALADINFPEFEPNSDDVSDAYQSFRTSLYGRAPPAIS